MRPIRSNALSILGSALTVAWSLSCAHGLSAGDLESPLSSLGNRAFQGGATDQEGESGNGPDSPGPDYVGNVKRLADLEEVPPEEFRAQPADPDMKPRVMEFARQNVPRPDCEALELIIQHASSGTDVEEFLAEWKGLNPDNTPCDGGGGPVTLEYHHLLPYREVEAQAIEEGKKELESGGSSYRADYVGQDGNVAAFDVLRMAAMNSMVHSVIRIRIELEPKVQFKEYGY